jgi:DUF971 family protein
MIRPRQIACVGDQVAISWEDGEESIIAMSALRAASPSAEQAGERDLLGKKMGGSGRTDYRGVTVTGWEWIGNYAVLFTFSDGHRTGIYPFGYLRQLGES